MDATSAPMAIVPPQPLREQQADERWRLFQDFLRCPLLKDRSFVPTREPAKVLLSYEDRLRGLFKQELPTSVSNYRLIININDVRTFNSEAARGLLQDPLYWMPPLERAVAELALPLRAEVNSSQPIASSLSSPAKKVSVGFEGAFGELHTSPRLLSSRHLGHMVVLDGIVTSCSVVRPKLVRSVHYNEATNGFVAKDYVDATAVGPTNVRVLGNNAYPTEDELHRKLVSEFGLSTFRDCQTVSLQEMPERAPPGQLPRAIDVLLADDLVDTVKPGDRVQAIGVYKTLASVLNGVAPGTFRALLVANNVRPLHGHLAAPAALLTPRDVAAIRAIGSRRDVVPLLARSLAPSIYGHASIKQAVLLMLLGGVERNFAGSGAHLRGDINVLLMGDPSTAKSQMLRFVLGTATLDSSISDASS